MANFDLESFPNEPKKLRRRKTGTLKLQKSNNRMEQITDIKPGTISNFNQILVFPNVPNQDIDCKEETSKINLNLSLNNFEFTFQFPNNLDSTKCLKVSSEFGPKMVDKNIIAEDTGATKRRVKSIMKKSKIEGKKTNSPEAYKKVSFLEGCLKEITNSLNGTSTDMKRATTHDPDTPSKHYSTRNKDKIYPLITNSATVNAAENVTIWKDTPPDLNLLPVKNRTLNQLLTQNRLDNCTIQLGQEEKNCDLAFNSETQEIFEPKLNCLKGQSLLQNLFNSDDHLNENKLFNGSSTYSNNESTTAEVPYNKTKLVYDQEIKSLDSAIRDLKIQRKKLAMKRRATKWSSFFWFTTPGKEKFDRHCDKTKVIISTSDEYSEHKMINDPKTQRKHKGLLSHRLPTKARNHTENFKN